MPPTNHQSPAVRRLRSLVSSSRFIRYFWPKCSHRPFSLTVSIFVRTDRRDGHNIPNGKSQVILSLNCALLLQTCSTGRWSNIEYCNHNLLYVYDEKKMLFIDLSCKRLLCIKTRLPRPRVTNKRRVVSGA